MKLQTKIQVLCVMIMLGFTALAYGVQRYLVFSSFLKIESSHAEADIQRCIEAVTREQEHLANSVSDWAMWDDTYRFVSDNNQAYIDSTLAENALDTGVKVDLLFILDPAGKVVWKRLKDLKSNEALSLPEFPPDQWPADSPLLARNSAKGAAGGIVLTDHGPMIVASGQVLPSNGQGASRGSLVMGRFLNEDAVKKLSEQTRVEFSVWQMNRDTLPGPEEQIADQIAVDKTLVVEDSDGKKLRVYHTYPDAQQHAALLVCALVPRDVSNQGREAMWVSVVTLIAAGLVLTVILLAVLQRNVVQPVAGLTRSLAGIVNSQDLARRLPASRADEIGILTRELNGMLERLERDSVERERLSRELERLSQHDSLTGLANRRQFDEAMTREWNRAMRTQDSLAFLMIDVDCFKDFNDHYGHQAGDAVLQKIASVLGVYTRRAIDLAARYGGEEFALVLPGMNWKDAGRLAENLRADVEALNIEHIKSHTGGRVTISLGFAATIPRQSSSMFSFISEADQALYHAKKAGRNQVRGAEEPKGDL
ncbi:MAG: diguanylate cyclase [Candidatus Hydrogenedentes bacterium]|nr:diguanylate cyclase [Candidatus Hydrogenedentota bacterium]